MTEPVDRPVSAATAVGSEDGAAQRPGPSAPIFVAGVVIYGAVGLGCAAIGGWIGITLVFLVAAAVIAALIRVS